MRPKRDSAVGCSLAVRVSDAEGLCSPGARPSRGKPRGQLQHDCGNGEILFALFKAEADKKTQRYRTGSGLWYFLSLSFPQFLQQPIKINKEPVLTLPGARVLGVPVPPPSSHPPNSITDSQLVSKKLQKFTWPPQRCRTRPRWRARGLWGSCGHGQPERSPAPPAGGRHPSARPPLKACAVGLERLHTGELHDDRQAVSFAKAAFHPHYTSTSKSAYANPH